VDDGEREIVGERDVRERMSEREKEREHEGLCCKH
jgi:hypothetical protein